MIIPLLTPLLARGRRFSGIEYNATTTSCVVADAAAIQDLHDAAFTAEAWVRADGCGESDNGRIFSKTASAVEGWYLGFNCGFGMIAGVYADTNAIVGSGMDEFTKGWGWRFVTMQFDDGGDRKIYLWVGGIPVVSYTIQTAAVGAIVTDVGNDLYFGNRSDNDYTFDGSLGGWARISKVSRYTNGVAFIPRPRWNPPIVDANTVWQTNYSDRSGAVLTDVSAGANHGALSNHVWRTYRG